MKLAVIVIRKDVISKLTSVTGSKILETDLIGLGNKGQRQHLELDQTLTILMETLLAITSTSKPHHLVDQGTKPAYCLQYSSLTLKLICVR